MLRILTISCFCTWLEKAVKMSSSITVYQSSEIGYAIKAV